MFALAHQLGDPKHQLRAFLCRDTAPRLKGLVGGRDGPLRKFPGRLVEFPDHLRAYGRIDAVECGAGLDALAANYQRIFAAEFAFYLLKRSPHRLRVLFFAEISKWFVSEFCWHHDWYARLRRALSLLVCLSQHAGGVRTYAGHSPAFCNFLVLRLTISRFSGDI